MSKKINIIITNDSDSEMMKIETSEGNSLFYGNYWDFNRDPESFAELFKALNMNTEIKEIEYEDWEDE